jgi:hypothetical protein
VKNIVKSDDSGTIAILNSPKLHLTARDKDGKLLFVRGSGYASTNTLELVQPDSVFRIASMTKSLTAAA